MSDNNQFAVEVENYDARSLGIDKTVGITIGDGRVTVTYDRGGVEYTATDEPSDTEGKALTVEQATNNSASYATDLIRGHIEQMKREEGEALVADIGNATDLDDLLTRLNKIEDLYKEVKDADRYGAGSFSFFCGELDAIPTFGGEQPSRLNDIYSWDEKRVLYGEGSVWSIEPRKVDED